ncbi:MAG: hypothetical protein VW405_15690 [Rhodospirillaceae bacterium]
MNGQVYYIPHGGGPLPLMGDPRHDGMVDMLRGLGPNLADSRAIVVVTAHWEEDAVSFGGAPAPGMLFDYYGFPPETYEYRYPAPAAPTSPARPATWSKPPAWTPASTRGAATTTVPSCR